MNIYAGHDWTTDEGLNLSKWFGFFSNLQYKKFWRTYFSVQRNLLRSTISIRAAARRSSSRRTRSSTPASTAIRGNVLASACASPAIAMTLAAHGLFFAPDGRFQVSSRLSRLARDGDTRRPATARSGSRTSTPTAMAQTTTTSTARLRRHVVNITARATYSFTRDMTLEAYLQPFVAVGDYSNIGTARAAEVVRLRAGDARRQP